MRNETSDPMKQDQPDRRRFSRDNFPQAEVERMAAAVAAEHRAKSLLLKATMGHRSLAMRQLIVSSIVGAMTMLLLYAVERMHPTMDRQTLNTWAIATFANIVLRAYLNRLTFPSSSPSEIARSNLLRILPLLVAILTVVQWTWSFQLFIGAELNLQVFILFAGLLAISVAAVGLWSSVPAPAILFLATIWPPFFFRLYQVGWIPWPVLVFIGFSVAMAIWVSVYLPVKQLRPILDGSDEVDLLVAKLHDANLDLTAANRTLDEMRKDAASQLESRSMFFASASHDFRQRLHAVKLLSRSAVHDAAVAQQEQAPLIRLADAVEDVDRYTTQMLDFARLDATALAPARRRVSLQHLFQQLELNFEEVALAANVTLKIRVTDAVLFTDISMLERILENLLSNAIKFSHGRSVLVGARPRAGGLTIEVWDRGPGIAPENLPSIFRPFYQSSPGRKGLGGVGLGLAVVERFAEALGYQITVQSRVGQGTLMRICVPASDIQDSDNHQEEKTFGIEQRSASAA